MLYNKVSAVGHAAEHCRFRGKTYRGGVDDNVVVIFAENVENRLQIVVPYDVPQLEMGGVEVEYGESDISRQIEL